MKAYTDLEQSKKLAEILPTESADMCWCNRCWCNSSPKGVDYIDKYAIHAHTLSEMKEAFDEVFTGWDKYWELIPAWSLSALLGLMPKSVCIKKTEHSGYFYFLEWQFANDNSLRYVGHNGDCLIDIYSDHDNNWKDSVDTAFEMVCWLKENNKI